MGNLNSALLLIDLVIEELSTGYARCLECGEKVDTDDAPGLE